jgi:hypothetical protein
LLELPKSAWVTSAGIVTLAVSLGARHATGGPSALEPLAAVTSWAGALLIIVGLGMMFFLES